MRTSATPVTIAAVTIQSRGYRQRHAKKRMGTNAACALHGVGLGVSSQAIASPSATVLETLFGYRLLIWPGWHVHSEKGLSILQTLAVARPP